MIWEGSKVLSWLWRKFGFDVFLHFVDKRARWSESWLMVWEWCLRIGTGLMLCLKADKKDVWSWGVLCQKSRFHVWCKKNELKAAIGWCWQGLGIWLKSLSQHGLRVYLRWFDGLVWQFCRNLGQLRFWWQKVYYGDFPKGLCETVRLGWF